MTDSNTTGRGIDTERARNMAAFDALPAPLRDALREAVQDYACEPVLSAWLGGIPVRELRRHLLRRDATRTA